MRVLVVGSGGREHALTWKLTQSPQVEQVYIAPGNGGTTALGRNVPLEVTDVPALVDFAQREDIGLTVVGPEAPLVAGLVDALQAAGRRAFGPTASAALLEGSKAFAKRFMVEEGIPTAPASIFDDYQAALAYLRRQRAPVVVKADGLAAGKGVFVCASLTEAEQALQLIMVERAFGAAGDLVLIEECLSGEEASFLAFSDGHTVVPMPVARDYKRIGDNDTGPNTGGMGGYAPSSFVSPELIAEVQRRVLQPTVDGMRRRGIPYVGVLYAGLMLTETGPRVLEFNCRFGDPETQVLLPLLETDLVNIFEACVAGRLADLAIQWRDAHTVSVVMASGGYPGAYAADKPITGIPAAARLPDVVVFHAGTRGRPDGAIATNGGRVLAVTASGPTLDAARDRAYAAVDEIAFDGAQYRRDIAAGAGRADVRKDEPASGSAYAASGVDIEAKARAFEMMLKAVESTYTPSVLAGMGPFGGLFSAAEICGATDPVLVTSIDGVGTKTMIAEAMGIYDTVGQDIVNHCLNDTLVQGARPLLFLDYVASGRLVAEQIAAIVSGCATACRELGCALIGGETAEMPGVYRPGAIDLVGVMLGWVERDAIIDGRSVRPGDICLGLSSSGLHTNGYSLARRVFADVGWDTILPELGRPVGEVLLTPHRAYLSEVEALWAAGVEIKAMAHITGGGFVDNIPRVLPGNVGVRLDRHAWTIPPIFRLIQKLGDVADDEIYRVLNMGIGLVIIVAPEQADIALGTLAHLTDQPAPAAVIGETVAWDSRGPRVLL